MKIVTFYSFKGGVGRTALLVNLGVHWAAQGRVVALMDLDLAAPGLSYSPLLGDHLDPAGRGIGMADLLNVFRGDTDGDEIRLIPPHQLLREMRLPPGHAPNGRLFAIGAGDSAYDQPVRRVEEDDAAIPGRRPEAGESREQRAYRALALHLRQDLSEWRVADGPAVGRGIDLLLIDARTGFGELRDLSLGYLADRMVMVSGLNDQNLRGLELTLDALKRRRVGLDEFPLSVTVVFSPVPAAEDESTLAALERGHRVIADALRRRSGGTLEMAPTTLPIHYTPLLATSDQPPLLRTSKSLYAREVGIIAAELEGQGIKFEEMDDEVLAARRRALRISGAPVSGSPAAADPVAAATVNPLVDLPDWRWPFEPDIDDGKAAAFAARLAPAAGVEVDRDGFLGLLGWSFSFESGEKGGIVDNSSRLSQKQFDTLMEIFDEERRRAIALWSESMDTSSRRAWIGFLLSHAAQWGGLLLGDAEEGAVRLSDRLLQGDPRFARWAAQPATWGWLAHRSIGRGDFDRAAEALRHGAALPGATDDLAAAFLAGLDPLTTPEAHWNAAMVRLGELLGDTPRQRFHQVQRQLRGPRPEPERAREGLAALLEAPPEDAGLCFELAAFALDHLPALAADAEGAIRRAVEREPGKAHHWNALGSLLTHHLQRYDEAEAAYRQAIEIDPKFAYPWNGLGSLLSDHLQRYDEAEAAYRQAIEIDPKFAAPINNLGLLQLYRGQCNEAAETLRRGLSLPAAADTLYLAMNLGHLLWQRGEREQALERLRQAHDEFAAQGDVKAIANTLWLALELNDGEAVTAARRRLDEAIAAGDEARLAGARLLAALIEAEPEQLADWRERAMASLEGFHDHHSLMREIYLLSGFRPEARDAGREIVAELLALPQGIVSRFKDRPWPAALYDRFRPFAEGRSRGAGDPADLERFCTPLDLEG